MRGAMLTRWKASTVPLCPRCHREWHDLLTPYLGGFRMNGTRKAAARWMVAQLLQDDEGARIIRRGISWWLRAKPFSLKRWWDGRNA